MNKDVNTVAAYLKKAQRFSRPLFGKVQKTEDGRQFITDGYTAFLWEEYRPEFDALPQAEASDSMNILSAIEGYLLYDVSQEEADFNAAVWGNIGKIKSDCVYIFGAVFTTADVKNAVKLCGKFSNFWILSKYFITMLKSKEFTALICQKKSF